MFRPQFGINANPAPNQPNQPDQSRPNQWNSNGIGPLVIGVGASSMRMIPPPVGVGITITADVLARAANHLPVNTPMPNVPMGPNWVPKK